MSARTAASWLLRSALPLAAACAFESGGGFTSLAPGELHAEFEPGAARDLGDGELLTDRGYRVQLRALTLHVEDFALLEVGAEQASFSEIVHVPIDRELDLLRGEEVALAPYEPSAELGAGTVARAELRLGRLAVSAVVEGGGLEEPRELDATVDVDEPLATPLALELDRDVPETIAPVAELRMDGALFDGIAFAALEGDEGIVEARLAEWASSAEFVVDLGVVVDGDHHPEEEEEGHAHAH